jgi:hypothetical protein
MRTAAQFPHCCVQVVRVPAEDMKALWEALGGDEVWVRDPLLSLLPFTLSVTDRVAPGGRYGIA